MTRLRDLGDAVVSPYLLSHVDNPVEWHRWDDDALELARERDVPIVLSIGYSACHWCHVMAHESFENDEIARQMNDGFVSIKVDREERPDLDALYMAATQATTGHGGWPMTVFLCPDGRPFYAGTYFPPTDRHGQPGFSRLLSAMSDAWRTQRTAVFEQAEQIERAIIGEVRVIDHFTPETPTRSWRELNDHLVAELVQRADPLGGFGPAPKFPRPSYIRALMWSAEPSARSVAQLTLDQMSRQGMYDHLEGGFARYSVDAQWHVPHFEKMLSDQALLARCYLDADTAAGGSTVWRDVALHTLRFVVDRLRLDHGFAAALDADTTNGEGAHVVFTRSEINDALAVENLTSFTDAVCARYRIEVEGDIEGRSILRLADGEPFVAPAELVPALSAVLAARRRRPQPARDDKVILEWNAMMCDSLLRSGDDELSKVGAEILSSICASHQVRGQWTRTGVEGTWATASDLAWLIEALVTAFEHSGDDQWLITATRVAGDLLEGFWDGDIPTVSEPHRGGGLFSSHSKATDLILRPKEIFDGATPSAHAVATRALARLGLITADGDLLAVAERLVAVAGPLLSEHAMAVPDLLDAFSYLDERREVVVPGDVTPFAPVLRSRLVPGAVTVTGRGTSPLLVDRREGAAYLCQRSVCAVPATNPDELAHQLDALVAR